MTVNTQQQEQLGKLMEQAFLALFDHAEDKAENHTGRSLSTSKLDQIKLKLASKAVNLVMGHLDRYGGSEQKLQKFLGLSNEHLPTLVHVLDEDIVLKKLDRIPDHLLTPELFTALENAGGHELAKLLRKTLPPELQQSVAKAESPLVPTTEAMSALPQPTDESSSVIAETFSGAAKPHVDDVVLAPARELHKGPTLEGVKSDLAAMKLLHDRMGDLIDTLEASLTRLERARDPARSIEPLVLKTG